MVIVIVHYDLAPSLSKDRLRELYEEATPRFEHLPGLIRKYFLIPEQQHAGGSVYLWESRQHALEYHNEGWMQFMQGKYGHRPRFTLYECPIVVDNLHGEVVLGQNGHG